MDVNEAARAPSPRLRSSVEHLNLNRETATRTGNVDPYTVEVPRHGPSLPSKRPSITEPRRPAVNSLARAGVVAEPAVLMVWASEKRPSPMTATGLRVGVAIVLGVTKPHRSVELKRFLITSPGRG